MVVKIETFAAEFTGDDSIILFEVTDGKMTKYGNAIHRDQPIVYFKNKPMSLYSSMPFAKQLIAKAFTLSNALL